MCWLSPAFAWAGLFGSGTRALGTPFCSTVSVSRDYGVSEKRPNAEIVSRCERSAIPHSSAGKEHLFFKCFD